MNQNNISAQAIKHHLQFNSTNSFKAISKHLHAQHSDSLLSQTTVDHLTRSLVDCHLYCKTGTSDPISDGLVSLHCICYDSADILFTLKLIFGTGYATDARYCPSIELVRGTQLADETFPAECKNYRLGRSEKAGIHCSTGTTRTGCAVTYLSRSKQSDRFGPRMSALTCAGLRVRSCVVSIHAQ